MIQNKFSILNLEGNYSDGFYHLNNSAQPLTINEFTHLFQISTTALYQLIAYQLLETSIAYFGAPSILVIQKGSKGNEILGQLLIDLSIETGCSLDEILNKIPDYSLNPDLQYELPYLLNEIYNQTT